MIIVLRREAVEADARAILDEIARLGLKPLHMPGSERVVLGALGDERVIATLHLENHPMVESVKPILSPYKLVSREAHSANSIVKVGDVPVGGEEFIVFAGPCAVESYEQFRETARVSVAAGARILRGGAYKPRTSPYSFQGLGVEGLKIMKDVCNEFNVPAITEVMDIADVDAIEKHVAGFQVGARNMQNFRLLTALGQTRKPVILKRGMAAKAEDLLLAAEYILAEGNASVILCERGIKTFETATRNTLDLNAIPYIKEHSHLPIIVDPSHGTGIRNYVPPLAKAGAAVGADGIIIELHPNPPKAMSDGQQSLYPEQFHQLMQELQAFVTAAGRTLAKAKS